MMISSRQNPLIKEIASLKQKKYRQQKGLFLIEGPLALKEALKFGGFDYFFYTPEFQSKEGELWQEIIEKCETYYQITPEVLKRISDTKTPAGALGVAKIPFYDPEEIFRNSSFCAILNDIGDPGNVGNLIRAASAFGLDALFFTPFSADPYSPKVVRSTMGALFHLPLIFLEEKEIVEKAKARNFSIYIAEAHHGTTLKDVKFTFPLLIVLGNETKGPSSLLAQEGIKVSIPIVRAESLNVASAGAIFFYEASAQFP